MYPLTELVFCLQEEYLNVTMATTLKDLFLQCFKEMQRVWYKDENYRDWNLELKQVELRDKNKVDLVSRSRCLKR